MKQFNTVIFALLVFALASCNMEVEWNDQTKAQFQKQCLSQMAKQFKADNPEEFCTCFVGKLEEKNLGMMDLIKESAGIAEECGANLTQ